jgi:hypothetical protein
MADLLFGIFKAIEDIGTKKRNLRSVISLSTAMWRDEGFTRDQALVDPQGRYFNTLIDHVHSLGVPIVAASGNAATTRRSNIDGIPQVLEGPDVPIINVGGAEEDGSRHSDSQGGDQLSIYAPITAVTQTKEDGIRNPETGTSLGKSAIYPPRTM